MDVLRICKHAVAFPDSRRINDRCWHRLANVVFAGLFAVLHFGIFKMLALDQRALCFSVMLDMELSGHASQWDCRARLLEFINAEPVWHREWLLRLIIFFALSLLVYSLVSRLSLYVGMGDRWKTP